MFLETYGGGGYTPEKKIIFIWKQCIKFIKNDDN